MYVCGMYVCMKIFDVACCGSDVCMCSEIIQPLLKRRYTPVSCYGTD